MIRACRVEVRLGNCSREFLCDLLKPAGLKDDLRLGVADDIASELLAFYDPTCIADAGRDVLICHVASDERTTFALENRFATTSWLCAKSQPKLNQTL